jgi:hypothetical protein
MVNKDISTLNLKNGALRFITVYGIWKVGELVSICWVPSSLQNRMIRFVYPGCSIIARNSYGPVSYMLKLPNK